MSDYSRSWGPSHQRLDLRRRHRIWTWLALGALLLLAITQIGSSPSAVIASALLLTWIGASGALGRAWQLLRAAERHGKPASASEQLPAGEILRRRMLRMGAGAYLGQRHGRWVVSDPEHAVLVLGPPRSGKTSEVVIPAVLAAPNALVSTATKPDVMAATWRARAEIGEVWLYDPAGSSVALPPGVRALHWSPVAAAGTWEEALLTARAMAAAGRAARGSTNEEHWRERASALLAPLLYAAYLDYRPIAAVLTWVLRFDLDTPGKILEDHGAQVPCDVLAGIARTESRERSSIFSATAGTLAAYNSDAVRQSAAQADFNPSDFPSSSDTIYITAPAHRQALCAPLVVGLLEQIRHATYEHAAKQPQGRTCPPVLFCLDELANIAPIHDLQALVSEAGGQGLHILACLQDLSQARVRWGESVAEGLLTLFQTKLILRGIADPKTLEAVSLVAGEYDRQMASATQGRTEGHGFFAPDTYSESVTHSTQRQRILTPGEIARPPRGRALLLEGVDWQLIRTTPWYRTAPWREAAGLCEPAAAQSAGRARGAGMSPTGAHAMTPPSPTARA
ncbi:MAG TPA: type IV secretory system conjugative DNA transfer family protein [Solirubrobacteraceae bacterium]|nr:type IV secretory system conjugative DNA transfer family protein [Solirubrobacteraceae bacterium]